MILSHLKQKNTFVFPSSEEKEDVKAKGTVIRYCPVLKAGIGREKQVGRSSSFSKDCLYVILIFLGISMKKMDKEKFVIKKNGQEQGGLRSWHEGSAARAQRVLAVLGCPTSSHTTTGTLSVVLNPAGFTEWDMTPSHNMLSKDAPFPFRRAASRTARRLRAPNQNFPC